MKKIRKKWHDYWKDDAYDMGKKHLSQHDKRALLYGGFMVSALTFILISIVGRRIEGDANSRLFFQTPEK